MGERVLDFYRNSIKKEYKIAFIFTFIITLLVHLYKFTNALPNNDSVINYYSNQNIIGSGRWALSFACGFSSYYDLPWIIGLFSCVFIALTTVVIVALFKVKNPVVIGLIGGLIGTSPATTETFFFLFTADGYMIAMLLAALGVYFTRIEEKRYIFMFLSIFCICVSCGIYQAYLSFALVLSLCYFIDIIFQNVYSKKDCTRWIVKQIIVYSISLLLYFLIWKLLMLITGTAPNDYQGISKVGHLNFNLIYNGVISSISTVLLFFTKADTLKDGLTAYTVINILFIILMFIILVKAFFKSKVYLRKWATVLVFLSLICVIPFACIWCFTSDSVVYRAMMLQSLTILIVYTVILLEKYAGFKTKNLACLFFVVMILNNSFIANINYFYLNLSYENTYAEGLEIAMKIHELQDNYKFDKIASFGIRMESVEFKLKDTVTNKYINANKDFVYGKRIDRSLIKSTEKLSNFIDINYGVKLKPVNEKDRSRIMKSKDFKEMKYWPSKESMRVIDDTLVIKFKDEYLN